MLDGIWLELGAYSALELIAVIASLLYITLAANNSRWCWPAAFISSVIFVVVMWNARLLMDSTLNFYYAIMAIVGWVIWNKTPTNNSNGNNSNINASNIVRWAPSSHLIAITAVLVCSLISGALLSRYSDAAFPYLDSFTTWGSLLATWMLAKKVLENWLYWIVLDAVSIYLYINKALLFTTFLFIIFVLMSIYAFYNWRRIATTESDSLVSQQAVS